MHLGCTPLTKDQYLFLKGNPDADFQWICLSCRKDGSAGSADPDDRIAHNGEKIDLLMRHIGVMQTQISNLHSELTKMAAKANNPGNATDRVVHQEVANQWQAQVAEALEEKDEKEEKKNNIIMFRVPEAEESNEEKEAEDDMKKVKEILAVVHPHIDSVDLQADGITRMGKTRKPGYTRPVKVKFMEDGAKLKIFRNASKLKSHKEFSKVNISSDKTKKELMADRELKGKLDEQRKERPDDDLIIYRGRIIKRKDRPGNTDGAAPRGAGGQSD